MSTLRLGINIDHVTISAAEEKDFPEIQRIYSGYVLNTTVSLEEEPPSVEEMVNRWHKSQSDGLPYITAKMGGKLVGYAYATLYRPRTAYRFTVEESVYVSDNFCGAGIGQELMHALIERCSNKGYKQMIAIIAGTDNAASIRFHETLDFKQAGILRNVGFKFGHWVDTFLMQKELV